MTEHAHAQAHIRLYLRGSGNIDWEVDQIGNVGNGEPASTNENTINIQELCRRGAMTNIEKANFNLALPLSFNCVFHQWCYYFDIYRWCSV